MALWIIGDLKLRAWLSQVDLPLGGLASWGGSGVVLRCLAQWYLLQATVFTRCVSDPGVGTAVRGHEPHACHFRAASTSATTHPTFLRHHGFRAAVGHQVVLSIHFLVRHEGGKLGGVLRNLAVGGRLAGHPAGVRVAKLSALPCAVTGHCHIWKGPEVCSKIQNTEKRIRIIYLEKSANTFFFK